MQFAEDTSKRKRPSTALQTHAITPKIKLLHSTKRTLEEIYASYRIVSSDVESFQHQDLGKAKIRKSKNTHDLMAIEDPQNENVIKEMPDEPDNLKPDFCRDEIIQLGFQVTRTDNFCNLVLESSQSFLFSFKSISHSSSCSYTIYKTINEKDLLYHFIINLKKWRPLLICGYNINSFDIPFILNQMEINEISFDFNIALSSDQSPSSCFFKRLVTHT
ncbi:hypothetical protein P9112_005837 [Eukaryota sp. TZLM1-RC]